MKSKIIQFLKRFNKKKYIGRNHEERSESDSGHYINFVNKAVLSDRYFKTFKQNKYYNEILEHLSKNQGFEYLTFIEDNYPHLLLEIDKFKINDTIGKPLVYQYKKIGNISPSTLRYVKILGDIEKYFGNLNQQKIVEIGAGYGGQLLILDQYFKIKYYRIFDLQPVLALVSKYLESFILNCSYQTNTINNTIEDHYDLVISNYAFSELPRKLQKIYVEKVLSKSKRGYMIMNSGKSNSVYGDIHMSIDELKELLPDFQIIDETPLSAPNNYVIVWGHI